MVAWNNQHLPVELRCPTPEFSQWRHLVLQIERVSCQHKHFARENTALLDAPVTYLTREYPAAWQRGEEAYYPVNDETNQALYARYAERAEKEKGVLFGGRLGEYKYYDMDKVIESALLCARKELG